jgi:4-methylaminobutanoate oxidase (formaldehyde-forming)
VIDSADVVVIGSGGLGAATAFSLTRRGAGRVALLDRDELGSQTSPRAAGMAAHARASDLMIALMRSAGAKLRSFSEDTGEPLALTRSGSLKVARRPPDAEVLAAEHERARRFGLDAELLSPEEAHRRNPLLQSAGVEAVLWVADDLYFEPSQVAIGFARAAGRLGATLLPHTTVTRVDIRDGHVTGVETDRGWIAAPVVVDAAGAWTRQVATLSGIEVPLVATRHQLVVTEPLDGVQADLPMVRIMDAAVYARPCHGGLLWGVFEEGPLQVDIDRLGSGFRVADLQLDRAVLERAALDVEPQLPVLRHAAVREHRGGLPTMTADGRHIVGPAPAVLGFFVASGCNVAGLSIAPALGDALAAWIVDGAPPYDLAPLALERFRGPPQPEDVLARETAWQYRHFYGAV